MTTTDAVLDRLLDAERLSGLLGRDVRAASVRAKPGALVVLGLAEATTGRPTGWVRVLWPELRVKATKVAERAARRADSSSTGSTACGSNSSSVDSTSWSTLPTAMPNTP